MYKVNIVRLSEEEINRVGQPEKILCDLSPEAREHLDVASYENILNTMAKIAENNVLRFDETYFYDYVKSYRQDFPWKDVVIEYRYEKEMDWKMGVPRIEAYFID